MHYLSYDDIDVFPGLLFQSLLICHISKSLVSTAVTTEWPQLFIRQAFYVVPKTEALGCSWGSSRRSSSACSGKSFQGSYPGFLVNVTSKKRSQAAAIPLHGNFGN